MSDIVFPTPPQTVHCQKCGRSVVVAPNPGRPGIESECKDRDCPIAADPNNRPTSGDGTLICFPDPDFAEPPKKQPEMLTLKPGLWGISVDLKEFWRRLSRLMKKR